MLSENSDTDAGWDRLLHVHGQLYYHDEAYIVGNRAALEALRSAVLDALNEGEGACSQFTADGEGYDLCVQLDDTDLDVAGRTWALPYTESFAQEKRSHVRWPHQRGRKVAQR